MSVNDGGPAFPHEQVKQVMVNGASMGHEHIFYAGMTLLDFFAAAALTGHLASHTGAQPTPDRAKAAEAAYQYAGAMLAARATAATPGGKPS